MKARLLLASAALTVIPAFGHHNIAAEYDVTRTISISGTISKVDFGNPHVIISLDVGNAHWNVETGGPGVMMREGITKGQFVQGSTISIFGYPAKDGSPRLDGRSFRFADGTHGRIQPWERDAWNPLRDTSWNWCEEVKLHPADCIK